MFGVKAVLWPYYTGFSGGTVSQGVNQSDLISLVLLLLLLGPLVNNMVAQHAHFCSRHAGTFPRPLGL